MPATAPLIKGFLPVRLKLSKDDETFFYVKEHQQTSAGNSDDTEGKKKKINKSGCTLFVVNAPVIPGVSTKLALRSLLGRYADVARVTVVPNPRIRRRPDDSNKEEEQLTIDQLALWSSKVTLPTFLPPINHEGKYAHVVFASSKGLKKTMQELHRVMGLGNTKMQTNDSDNESDSESNKEESLPGLTMDRLEIQTLADETFAQYERDERKRLGKDPLENGYDDGDDDEDDFEDYDEEGNQSKKKTKNSKKSNNKEAPLKGALAVAKRYRESRQALSRAELLAECNRVMGDYEKSEEAKRKAHQQAKDGNTVDDDGFITVSYSSNTATTGAEEGGGIHNLLEESITTTTTSHSRRKAAPRRRNNNSSNKKKGSSELQDFYRFQRKEYKKRTLDQLRTQFEEDLRKIKKMKEEHHYRPFGR
mmetsp:Transcript_9649/g.22642  ORF Transcript_9649/g.22642 Transcript_9649/m.22642 type:complete len:420 (-) Transcript_9649:124-1383(-)